MAIEAERLVVNVEARGGDATAREIRGVGTSAVEASRGVESFDSSLGDAASAATRLSGVSQALSGRLDSVDDELSEAARSATGAAGGLQIFANNARITTGASRRLQESLDQVDHEFDEVRNSAMAASGALGAYSGASTSAALASMTMHDALIAGAIPSLIVLGSTLGPLTATIGGLVAGLGGLAAGFGAVVGSGVIAWNRKHTQELRKKQQQVEKEIKSLESLKATQGGLNQKQRNRLHQLRIERKRLKEQAGLTATLKRELSGVATVLQDEVLAMGKPFISLIDAAIAALPTFIRRVFDAAGSLRPFARELRRLGSAAMTVIPNMVQWIFNLGRQSIPVWRSFTTWVGNKTPGALQFLGSIVSATLPYFKSLTLELLSAMKVFTQFGVTATQVVVPMLNDILQGFKSMLRWVMDLPGPLQKATIALGALAPVLTTGAVLAAKLTKVLAPLVSRFMVGTKWLSKLVPRFVGLRVALGALGGVVGAFAAAYLTNWAKIRDITNQVASVIGSEFIATVRVAKSVILPIVRDIANAFGLAGINIERAVGKAAQAFGSVLVPHIRTGGALIRAQLGDLQAFWQRWGTSIIQTTKYVFEQLNYLIEPTFKGIKALIKRDMYSARIWFGTALHNMRQDAEWFRQAIPQAFALAFGAVRRTTRSALDALASITRSHFPRLHSIAESGLGLIVNAYYGAWGDAETSARNLFETLTTLFRGGLSRLGGLARRGAALVKQAFLRGFAALPVAYRMRLSALATITRVKLGLLKSLAESGLAIVVNAYYGAWGDVETSARNLFETLQALTGSRLRVLKSVAESGLAIVVNAYYGAWGDVETSARNLFGTLASVFKAGFKPVRQAARIGAGLVKQAIIGVFKALPQEYRIKLVQLVAATNIAFGQIKRAVDSKVSAISQTIDTHFTAVSKTARQSFRQVRLVVEKALSTLNSRVVQPVLATFSRLWSKYGGEVKRTATQAMQTIERVVGDAMDFVKRNPAQALSYLATTVVPGPLSTIVAAFRNNFGTIKKEVRQTWQTVKRSTRRYMQAVKRQIINPLSTAKSQTRSTLGSMHTEFDQTFGMIRDIATRILREILQSAGKFWRKMVSIWSMHMSGNNGILANTRTAFNALWNNIIKPTLDLIQGAWNRWGDELITILRFTLDIIRGALTTAFDALLTITNAMLQAATLDWEGAWNTMAGFFERTFEGVTQFVEKWGSGFLTWLNTSFVQPVVGWFDDLKSSIVGSGGLIPSLVSDVSDFFKGLKADVVGKNGFITTMVEDIKGAFDGAAKFIQDSFNAIVPDSISIPKVNVGGGSINLPSTTIAGQKIGGGSLNIPSISVGGQFIDLPQLDTGGFIEEAGLAMLHQDEMVLPAAEVDRSKNSAGGPTIENIYIKANSREEGRAGGRGLVDELRSQGFGT